MNLSQIFFISEIIKPALENKITFWIVPTLSGAHCARYELRLFGAKEFHLFYVDLRTINVFMLWPMYYVVKGSLRNRSPIWTYIYEGGSSKIHIGSLPTYATANHIWVRKMRNTNLEQTYNNIACTDNETFIKNFQNTKLFVYQKAFIWNIEHYTSFWLQITFLNSLHENTKKCNFWHTKKCNFWCTKKIWDILYIIHIYQTLLLFLSVWKHA